MNACNFVNRTSELKALIPKTAEAKRFLIKSEIDSWFEKHGDLLQSIHLSLLANFDETMISPSSKRAKVSEEKSEVEEEDQEEEKVKKRKVKKKRVKKREKKVKMMTLSLMINILLFFLPDDQEAQSDFANLDDFEGFESEWEMSDFE